MQGEEMFILKPKLNSLGDGIRNIRKAYGNNRPTVRQFSRRTENKGDCFTKDLGGNLTAINKGDMILIRTDKELTSRDIMGSVIGDRKHGWHKYSYNCTNTTRRTRDFRNGIKMDFVSKLTSTRFISEYCDRIRTPILNKFFRQ